MKLNLVNHDYKKCDEHKWADHAAAVGFTTTAAML